MASGRRECSRRRVCGRRTSLRMGTGCAMRTDIDFDRIVHCLFWPGPSTPRTISIQYSDFLGHRVTMFEYSSFRTTSGYRTTVPVWFRLEFCSSYIMPVCGARQAGFRRKSVSRIIYSATRNTELNTRSREIVQLQQQFYFWNGPQIHWIYFGSLHHDLFQCIPLCADHTCGLTGCGNEI
jgi:hypothetical protein